jgi:hypothetical protein
MNFNLKFKLHLSHRIVNHQQDIINSSSMRSIRSLDIHRKITRIIIAYLQTSEEEVVGYIEDVNVVANIRTPY